MRWIAVSTAHWRQPAAAAVKLCSLFLNLFVLCVQLVAAPRCTSSLFTSFSTLPPLRTISALTFFVNVMHHIEVSWTNNLPTAIRLGKVIIGAARLRRGRREMAKREVVFKYEHQTGRMSTTSSIKKHRVNGRINNSIGGEI